MTSRERTCTIRGSRVPLRPLWSAAAAVCALALCGIFAAAGAGVTVHEPGLAFSGYNLRVSHDPPGAVLMDMDGDVLHRWTCSFEQAFPGVDVPDEPWFSDRWTNVRLMPDGDVLGIFGGMGMVRLDWSSRVVWAHQGGEHDDVVVTDNGDIYVIGSESSKIAWVNQRNPINEDFVLILDGDGEVSSRMSLLSAVDRSDFSNVTKAARMDRSNRVLHANALHVLDGSLSDRIPSFRDGNVLVSFRGLDTIGVLDVESGTIVWTQFGMWLDQLDLVSLPGGGVLVFEYEDGDPKVLEFDPVTQEVVWSYVRESSGPTDGPWGGAVHRLPNGNTLISESARGRAFEVTRAGELVWEYVSPESAGESAPAAMPFELVRIERESIADWLGQ